MYWVSVMKCKMLFDFSKPNRGLFVPFDQVMMAWWSFWMLLNCTAVSTAIIVISRIWTMHDARCTLARPWGGGRVDLYLLLGYPWDSHKIDEKLCPPPSPRIHSSHQLWWLSKCTAHLNVILHTQSFASSVPPQPHNCHYETPGLVPVNIGTCTAETTNNSTLYCNLCNKIHIHYRLTSGLDADNERWLIVYKVAGDWDF